MSGLFSSLFGGIESGNNPSVGLSSTGAAGEYQQFLPFQEQFGGNTTGSVITDPDYEESTAENFASQAIANNPNITAGDLYAEYNLGSGTPGSGATFSQLSPSVQNNFNANASGLGVSYDTPASSLFGGATTPYTPSLGDQDYSGGDAGADIAGSVAMGDNPYGYDTSDTSSGTNTVPTGSAAGAPGATDPVTAAGQVAAAAGSAISAWYSTLISGIENFAERGAIMFLAGAIAIIALIALVKHQSPTTVIQHGAHHLKNAAKSAAEMAGGA